MRPCDQDRRERAVLRRVLGDGHRLVEPGGAGRDGGGVAAVLCSGSLRHGGKKPGEAEAPAAVGPGGRLEEGPHNGARRELPQRVYVVVTTLVACRRVDAYCALGQPGGRKAP